MQAALNDHCFAQPHWRVIAQGFRPEPWFGESLAVGTGGIRNPQPMHLAAGHYYYRFGSSKVPREAQLSSGWWLEFDEFIKIRSFAQEHEYSIGEAARLMLALPHAWTRADVLVKALLCVPLKAYAGEGKPAQGAKNGTDKGTAWVPTQHIKVRQLYIPGLFIDGPRPREQLYKQAFANASYSAI